MNKKFWSLVIVCNLALGIWNLPAYAEEKIIAVVNDEIITQKDLNDFLNFTRMQLSQELEGKELESRVQAMKLDLLDRLIEDKLIQQEAKKNNIKIDEAKIKARIDEVRKQYGTEALFQSTLAKQGLTQADLEKRIREQFMMYGVVDAKVRSRIVVNPKETTDFYEKNKDQLKIPERREIISLMINPDRRLANSIFYDLKDGADLIETIKKYSLKASRVTVRKNGELKKELEEEIFGLALGGISKPVEINNAYYIFKVEEIITPQQQSLSEVQGIIHAQLFEEQLQKDLSRWLEELKKKAYIKIS